MVWASAIRPTQITTKLGSALVSDLALAESMKPVSSLRSSAPPSGTSTVMLEDVGGFIAKGFDGMW